MATPNYGLLRDVKPLETPNIIGSFLAGKSMAQEEKMRDQELQSKMLDAKMKQEELEYRPQERAMKEAEHQLALQQTKAQIGQIGAATAHSKAATISEQLRQKKEKLDLQEKELTWNNKILTAAQDLPPDIGQTVLDLGIKTAASRGNVWPENIPKNIEDPRTQNYLKSLKIQNQALLGTTKINQERFNNEAKLRGEYEKEIKPLTQIADNYARVKTLVTKNQESKNPTSTNDMAALYAYMKIINPNAPIREGTLINAAEAEGLPQQAVQLYNNTVNGQKLTPNQRREIINTSRSLYQTTVQQAEKVNQRFKPIIDQYQLDPNNILQRIEPEPVSKPKTIPEGTIVRGKNGLDYEFIGGKYVPVQK